MQTMTIKEVTDWLESRILEYTSRNKDLLGEYEAVKHLDLSATDRISQRMHIQSMMDHNAGRIEAWNELLHIIMG